MAASLVPVDISNWYQWRTKAPGEKSGVLGRGHWSRLAGTDCKTSTYGRFRPVSMDCFLVVTYYIQILTIIMSTYRGRATLLAVINGSAQNTIYMVMHRILTMMQPPMLIIDMVIVGVESGPTH